MASGVDRLKKLIDEEATKEAEEKLKKQYGTYTYNAETKSATKKAETSNENKASQKTAEKTNNRTTNAVSGVDRLREAIGEETIKSVTGREPEEKKANQTATGEKDSFLEWLGKQATKGAYSFDKGLSATLDFLLPTELMFGEEKDPISRLNNYYGGQYETSKAAAEQSSASRGNGWGFAGEVASGTVEAVPNVLLAIMSGGGSLAAQGATLGAKSAPGLINTLQTTATTMAKNPMYWTSFAQTVGRDYEESKAEGASDLEATASAMLSGLLNAGVEVSGGLEVLPSALRTGGSSAVRSWVKSMFEEGKEEVVQGVISNLTEKTIYDRGKEYFSLDDQNAVINPSRMGTEFALGASIGGLLGGASVGSVSALNAYSNRQYNRQLDNAGRYIQENDAVGDIISTGLESDRDTESYRLAAEFLERQNAGEELSANDIGRLYAANIRTIRSEEANSAQIEPQSAENRTANNSNVNAEKSAVSSDFASIPAYTEQDRMKAAARESQNAARYTDAISKLGDSGAKAVSAFYDSSQDFDSFNAGFSRFYEAGISNVPFDRVQTEYARNISPEVQQAAWSAGLNDRKASMDKANEMSKYATIYGKSGGVVMSGEVETAMSNGQIKSETVDLLNEFGKKTGAKIRFVEHIGAIGVKGNNGYYSNGVVTIALDSTDPYTTVAVHEITHHMQKISPKEYIAFRDFAVSYFADKDGGSPLSYVEQKRRFYADNDVVLSQEEAMDEAAAEFAEMVVKNEVLLRNFAENAEKTVVQKFFDSVKDFLKKIRGLSKRAQNRAAMEEYGTTVGNLEKAVSLWEDTLKVTQERVKQTRQTATEKSSDVAGDVQYSVKTVNGKQIVWIENSGLTSKQLRDYKAVANYIAEHIGEVYTIIESGQKVYIGEDLPGEFTQSKYTDFLHKRDRGTLRAKNKTVSDLGLLIETATGRRWEKTKHDQSKDAKYGMYRYDSCFAFPAKDRNGNTVSVHAYDAELLIRNASNGKKYLYDIVGIKENTVKAVDLLRMETRLAAHKAAPRDGEINKNISQTTESVKGQFSLKDSTGRTLTEQQAEFFKDSKVRDKDGNLQVVYHGTGQGGFTVFEDTDDIGYFFTDSLYTARTYSGSRDIFQPTAIKTWDEAANIVEEYGHALKKDGGKFVFTDMWGAQKIFGKDEIKKFVKLWERDYIDPSEEKYVGDTNYSVYLNITNPLVVEGDSSLWDDIQGKNTREWVREAAEQGHDGVIFRDIADEGEYGFGDPDVADVFVAFNPNQIKATNNAEPTDDSDVRFSLKDSKGRTLSEAQQKYFKDSKVRDKSGKLLVMYQGGNGDFTVFDRKKSKASNLYGRGFYFTDSESHAKQYGKARPFYLNIKNPLIPGQHEITKPQIRNFLEAVSENEDDYSFENYGYGATVDSVLEDVFGKGDFETLQDISATAIGDLVEAVELFNSVNGTDYDGIMLDTETVTFNSNQAKNVDNLTPTDDPDIRFSMKNSSVDGAGPVASKEFKAWFGDWSNGKGSKVVDDDGKPLVVYHGTGTTIEEFLPEFTGRGVDQYGSGFYFTNRKSTAEGYTTRTLNGQEKPGGMESPNVIPVYLNIRHPIIVNASETPHLYNFGIAPAKASRIISKAPNIMDPEESILGDFFDEYWERGPQRYMISQLANKYDWTLGSLETDIFRDYPTEFRQAVNEVLGYDGVQINFGSGEKHFVAWFPNQIKHATENSGAFSKKDDRIKFSLKGQSDLLKENARLKEYNEYLKGQMKVTKFVKQDKKAMGKLTKDLLKENDSQFDQKELYAQLNGLYDYMANGTPVWNELKAKAREVAKNVLENAVVVNDDYAGLRKQLKNTRLYLSEQDRADLRDGYNEFRKANFGRLTLTNDGTPVDQAYQELSDMYPEFFDADLYTHPAEQLEHIADVLEGIRRTEENPFSHDMQQATEWLANDLIDRFFEIPQAKKTFADKQAGKLTKQKIKDAEKMRRALGRKDAQIEKIRQHAKERIADAVKKEKAAKWEKVYEIKQAYSDRRATDRERQKARELRAKILRHIGPMKEKVLRPSDKNHVPQEMRQAVAAVLDAINLESSYTYDPATGGYKKNDEGLPTRRTEAFHELREAYKEILKTPAGEEMVIDPSLFGVEAEGIASKFDEVMAMRDTRLADMTVEELATVWEVLRAVESSIVNAGKMLSRMKYQTTADLADAFHSDTKTRRDKTSFTRKHFTLDLETPYTFFSHYGKAGKDFFRMLRNAQDYEQTMHDELAEKVQKVVSKEQRKKLEKDAKEFHTSLGDKITLTKAHIMELYLLNNRPQAEGHLLRGGIVQPEIGRKIRRGTDAILLNEIDLGKMFATLTEEEKAIADKFQKLTGFLADKGNEASMAAYRYEKFSDPNYWPIKSAKEGIQQSVEKGQDQPRSIKNMGAAKQTVPHASNPLDIRGLFSTFDQHASDMLTYSAWLIPMEDANRLFNFRFKDENGIPTGKTLKGLLNRVGGANSDQYWLRLMEDIQNGIGSSTDSHMGEVVNKLIGNVRKASVASNLRVVVQQPTAYLRAMVALSPENMTLGIAKGATKGNGWEKALKYAPVASRKSLGGFEINASADKLSNSLYAAETKRGKAVEGVKAAPFFLASKADAMTWGAIWNASEWQIAKTRKDLKKGSEDFYKATAELFTDVIDQTQVVDGVLQRSQIMRSSKDMNKQATAFMGEPTVSLNLVVRAYDNFRYETNPKKRSAARKTLGMASFALVVANVAVAVAQSLADASRDDNEDEKYWERFRTALTGISGDEETWEELAKNILLGGNLANAMNPATWIPYINGIVSLAQGYKIERMDASTFGDFLSAAGTAIKSFSGEGKWTPGYAVAKTAATGAKLFGSSLANIMRDTGSIYRSVLIETDDWRALYEMEKRMYNITNQKSRFMDILYKTLRSGDEDAYSAMVADLIDNGITGKEIESAMKSRAKGDESLDLSINRLSEYDTGLASIGVQMTFPEPEETRLLEEFKVEDLSGSAYVEYMDIKGEILTDVISDFQSMGFGDLDEETANNLIDAAYDYANSVALQEASGGRYVEDVKWILNADKVKDKLGLGAADYIMYRQEYGSSYFDDTDGYDIYDAHEDGVDAALYLAAKYKYNHTDAKDANRNSVNGLKKERMIEWIYEQDLTRNESDTLYYKVFGYKDN